MSILCDQATQGWPTNQAWELLANLDWRKWIRLARRPAMARNWSEWESWNNTALWNVQHRRVRRMCRIGNVRRAAGSRNRWNLAPQSLPVVRGPEYRLRRQDRRDCRLCR